jgi:hypothetical protein
MAERQDWPFSCFVIPVPYFWHKNQNNSYIKATYVFLPIIDGMSRQWMTVFGHGNCH